MIDKNQKSKTKDQKLEIDIEQIAKLANLKLTKAESEEFSPQLSEIVAYISKLNEVDTEKIEPIGHIAGLDNITRDDTTRPSLSQEEALANAPKTHNGFFQVDAIFEDQ